MSKILAVVVGAALVISAAGGWKKLFSPRNVQSAARTIRETKDVFMTELKAPSQAAIPHEKPPSTQYDFTKPSEPLATHYEANQASSSSTPDNTSPNNTEKKE